ncbi:MAG: DNA mismatch repair protein MutS [Candidatus Electryonea clarkiae]|nr:DNA mismatch repair protein MutS [Candidatus Electryonea clarkiae]MDP8286821.1 DNA mismatch repair protein MutS [Candidatus Electryonea clarkiae]
MATPMMEQYFRIKKLYPDDIIFFRMGDFYELFHDDAVRGHELLGITLTKRGHGKGTKGDVPLCGFPHHQLESYTAKLTRQGVRVVVVDQVEDPKKAQGLVKRDIVHIVTAGTAMSEETVDSGRNQFLAAVVSAGQEMGVAICDATTGEFTAASFSPSGKRTASKELGDLLDLINPSEVIFPEDQRDEFRDIIPSSAMRTAIPPWIFDATFARDTLTGHFKVQSLKGYGIDDDESAVCAAGAALHYIRENLRTDPDHIRSLSRLPTEKYLLLDSTTRRNLEIIDPLWGSDRRSTLFYHIDFTVTSFGRRQFVRNLMNPLINKDEIERRLDAVENLVNDKNMLQPIREKLRSFGDLERLLARLASGRGSPRDAGAIRDTLALIPDLALQVSSASAEVLLEGSKSLDPLSSLVEFLQGALPESPPLTMIHGNAIADGFDERLDELRSIARGGKDFILSRQEEERESTGISSLAIKYNKVFGYYIEVSKVNLDKVPDYYIRKQTLVNAERYITPELKEWEEKIVGAEEEILVIERELFEQIRQTIIKEAVPIQLNARILAEIDAFASAAHVAVENKYIRPLIRTDNLLQLTRSRHPVIENLLPVGERFVPNDIDLDGKNRQVALVTGPNMGGKSTYLRQVGLIVLMAHAGLFVPAEKAEIPLTDRIFTRVGASDNLAAGESTFLVEMHEAANILHNATDRSLILLDEIGRGTSTFDGLSLAWAIVEYLHDFPDGAKPKTLFATHYHELTELETVLGQVINLYVEVKEWGDRVIFLRKVKAGKSGSSYGIQVAKLAGLPNTIIERAKEILDTLEASEFTDGNIPRLAKNSGASRIPLPKEDPMQMTLFTVEERKIRDKLAELDINNMTPLEALRILAEWKTRFSDTADETTVEEE